MCQEKKVSGFREGMLNDCKECIRLLNGLEKTLERKIPEKDRRWKVEEETAEYVPYNEPLHQGWPLADTRNLTPETFHKRTTDNDQRTLPYL